MKNQSVIVKLAKESDQERWDNFILNHSNASPYHLFAWKKAIELTYKHKCYYLMVENETQIQGVMPIVCLHFPAMVSELVSLPFCDVGNCIAVNKNAQDLLLKETIKLKEQKHIKKIQIRGDIVNTDFAKSNFQRVTNDKVRMFLDLPNSTDELFKSFKSKLRSQVRKAEKNGVTFSWGSVEDIDIAYDVFSKNMLELGSPVHSKFFIKQVLTNYANRAKLGMVKRQDKIIGMGIILLGNKGVSIPWASTIRKYNRLGPNMLLYWNLIKFSTDNGYSFFDFGRSSEGEGTYRFKQQWGAKPIPLVWYELKKKRTSKIDQHLAGFGKRLHDAALWQKLPLSIANMIGPLLRKYISL